MTTSCYDFAIIYLFGTWQQQHRQNEITTKSEPFQIPFQIQHQMNLYSVWIAWKRLKTISLIEFGNNEFRIFACACLRFNWITPDSRKAACIRYQYRNQFQWLQHRHKMCFSSLNFNWISLSLRVGRNNLIVRWIRFNWLRLKCAKVSFLEAIVNALHTIMAHIDRVDASIMHSTLLGMCRFCAIFYDLCTVRVNILQP